MRVFRWLMSITILFALAGCGMQSEKRSASVVASPAPSEEKMLGRAETEASGEDKLSIQPRKVIKEGDLEFETSDIGKTRKNIDKAVAELGAYIAKDREFRYGNRIEQKLVIRAPASKFDSLLEIISNAAGKLDSRTVSVRDVTEEFVDMEARLKTKKELENRYRELLDKAETVKDILAIEREMGKLREEIESVEGRLKYLSDRVSFSTLRVTFYQKVSTVRGLTLSRIKSALADGWNNLMSFVVGMLSIWPFIIVIVAGYFGIRRYRRNRKKAKNSSD